MDRQVLEFRNEISGLSRRRPTDRYPADLRARITAFVDERVGRGGTYRELARELGLRHETLERWHRTGVPMIPVRVVESAAVVTTMEYEATVTVCSPTGWRVEELPVSAAIELLKVVG